MDDCDSLILIVDGARYRLPYEFIHTEHPGGAAVLQRLRGLDVSEQFAVIHPPAARQRLMAFREPTEVQPLTATPSAAEHDFCQLRRDLEQSGELVPVAADSGIWHKVCAAASLQVAGAGAALTGSTLSALLLVGGGFELVGTASHDIAHLPRRARELSLLRWVPEVWLGASTSWWNASHWAHHAAPNVEAVDPDALVGFAAWTAAQLAKLCPLDGASRGSRLRRSYFRWQHVWFHAWLLLLRPAYTVNSLLGGRASERARLAAHIPS